MVHVSVDYHGLTKNIYIVLVYYVTIPSARVLFICFILKANRAHSCHECKS